MPGRIALAVVGFGSGVLGLAPLLCLGASIVYGFVQPDAGLSIWLVLPALAGILPGDYMRALLGAQRHRRRLDQIGEDILSELKTDTMSRPATESPAERVSRGRLLTVFPAVGASGLGLAKRIQALADDFGYDVRIEDDITRRAGTRACYCGDVAIFDLTASTDDPGAYRALPPVYASLDHALLVSRTPLPLNLMPARPGGAPPYPFPVTEYPDGTAVRFPDFTLYGGTSQQWIAEDDQSILEWLRTQLTQLSGQPSGHRLPLAPFDAPAWYASPEVLAFTEAATNFWLNRDPDSAFVSYRAHAYDAVLALRASAAEGQLPGVGAKSLRVISPSELAVERELLSAGRRWMVLSTLRLLMRRAPELWVYRTSDYLMSWWTLAELVLFAQNSGEKDFAHRLRIYDAASQTLSDDAGDLRIPISEQQRSLLWKFIIETSPGVSSPPMPGIGSTPLRPTLPRHGSGTTDWDDFWNVVLIDRRILKGDLAQYEPTVDAFLDAIDHMVRVDQSAIAAADGGTVRAADGTRLRAALFVPRLLYTSASSTFPERQILRVLPTFYALP
jgi:hypothetical protein